MCLIQCAQRVNQLFLVRVLQDRQAKRQAMSTAGCPPIVAHEVMIISPLKGTSLPCHNARSLSTIHFCTAVYVPD